MRWLVLLATLSLAACGGTQIPQHNGYKANAKPWKKFKTLKFDEKGEAKADGDLVVHDAKKLRVDAREDTLLAAYLIDPGRAAYELDDLAAEYGVELLPVPAADEETTALVRRAESPRRLIGPLLERLEERGVTDLYRTVELPLTAVLADMEAAGVKIDTYRMGEITARLADRVEELESLAYELAGEEFMIGSTQQVGRVLFEQLGLTTGRKGKTGYSTDAKVLRSIRAEHAIVPVIEEWREYSKLLNTYLGPLPSLLSEHDARLHSTFNQTVAATGRLSAKCAIVVRACAERSAVQQAMVDESSQWTSVSPPAAPAVCMTRVKASRQGSNEGKHMKIFRLDCPAATAGATSAQRSGVGSRTTAWKKTSAMACSATSADSLRIRSAIVSPGMTYVMFPTVVMPPASAAWEPLV